MANAIPDAPHAKPVATLSAPALIAIVCTGIFSTNTLADDAPAVHQQLETGRNVRVIDLGAEGMNELSEAVKRLNAPPPAPPANDAAAAEETGADGEAGSADAGAPTSETAPPETPVDAPSSGGTVAGGEHPAWLLGKWSNGTECAEKNAAAGLRIIAVAPQQIRLAGQACDIKAASSPKPDEAVMIYLCRTARGTTQEAHVFRRADADTLLLDHVENFKRCPSP